MLDFGIFFLFQNIFLVTSLFWLLTFIGNRFFKKKEYISSTEIFECGFLTTHTLNLNFNYNFFIIAILLILYDVEFFFLVPFFFNYTIATLTSFLLCWVFLIFIVISFVYDWQMTALNWSI